MTYTFGLEKFSKIMLQGLIDLKSGKMTSQLDLEVLFWKTSFLSLNV